MLLTSNFGLKKPEETDPVDVRDFNDNAEIIDSELKKRPESDGAATDMTVEFTAATQLTELTNKDSLKGLFGKLAATVKTVIDLAKNAITTSNIGNQSVKYAESAGAVAWGNVSGKPSAYTPTSHTHGWDAITGKPSAYTPAAHTHDYIPTSASCNKNWHWSGQGGQPTWLWGGEDGSNMYVYNPANFNVTGATYASYGRNNDFSCGYARMYHSNEGGNFRATSPNGVACGEFDAFSSACARIYFSVDGASETSGLYCYNGSVAGYVNGAAAGKISYSGAALYTGTSNKASLGQSNKLWTTVYAKTGSINTSDRTKKHDIKGLTEVYEKLFLMLQPKSFIFNDGDRVHIGAISQDVEDAMQKLDIEPEQFAGFCKDVRYEYTEFDEDGEGIEESKRPVTDKEGNVVYDYALRYQEFIFLTIHMTQVLWGRVDALEEENKKLWTKMEQMEARLVALEKMAQTK